MNVKLDDVSWCQPRCLYTCKQLTSCYRAAVWTMLQQHCYHAWAALLKQQYCSFLFQQYCSAMMQQQDCSWLLEQGKFVLIEFTIDEMPVSTLSTSYYKNDDWTIIPKHIIKDKYSLLVETTLLIFVDFLLALIQYFAYKGHAFKRSVSIRMSKKYLKNIWHT